MGIAHLPTRGKNDRYAVSMNADGAILLTPLASIPKRELLVWENDELRASLFRGLADAAEGDARPVLLYTREAEKIINDLRAEQQYATKLTKVRKALRLLEQAGPRHPGLHSHDYQSVPGPGDVTLWESYVENRTPSAWRIWWIYGPEDGQLTIVTIGLTRDQGRSGTRRRPPV